MSLKLREGWCSVVMMHQPSFKSNALLEIKEHVWILVIEF